MTTEPMPSVSPSPVMTQSVMAPSVRVTVTVTSPIPWAVPVYSPDTPPEAAVEDAPLPQAVRPNAMTAARARAVMRFLIFFPFCLQESAPNGRRQARPAGPFWSIVPDCYPFVKAQRKISFLL